MKKVNASIIILTKNPGSGFNEILEGVFLQEYKSFEVILIDSGSTDGTLEIAAKFPIRIHQIKPSEFGHGKTRNLGARLANGKYVVYITHDAKPKDKTWLFEMLKPFEDKEVAGVYGRQVPRENENVLDKLFFLTLYGTKRIEWKIGSYSSGDNIFSDANSALRKDLLLRFPHKNNIIVSEDYLWANSIMKKGYKVIYQPSAQVVHSHSYNLHTLFKRNFDVGVSYKYLENFGNNKSFIKKGSGFFLNEIRQLIDAKKVHLIPNVFIRDVIRFVAINLGKNETLFSKELKKNYLSGQRWYWK